MPPVPPLQTRLCFGTFANLRGGGMSIFAYFKTARTRRFAARARGRGVRGRLRRPRARSALFLPTPYAGYTASSSILGAFFCPQARFVLFLDDL